MKFPLWHPRKPRIPCSPWRLCHQWHLLCCGKRRPLLCRSQAPCARLASCSARRYAGWQRCWDCRRRGDLLAIRRRAGRQFLHIDTHVFINGNLSPRQQSRHAKLGDRREDCLHCFQLCRSLWLCGSEYRTTPPQLHSAERLR